MAETTSVKKSAVTVRTWATNNVMTRTTTLVMAVTTSVLSKMAWLAMEETKLGMMSVLKTVVMAVILVFFLVTMAILGTAMAVMILVTSRQDSTVSTTHTDLNLTSVTKFVVMDLTSNTGTVTMVT